MERSESDSLATRKSWHAAARLRALHTGMYLIGCTSYFWLAHQELSKAALRGSACTLAMASGLTDHLWSFGELLRHKVAPPLWVELKRHRRALKPVAKVGNAH